MLFNSSLCLPLVILSLEVLSQDFIGSMWGTPAIKAIEKSAQQGATTTTYAALSRDFQGKGGVYLSNCAIMGPFKGENSFDVSDDGYAPYTYDAASEGRLWKDSLMVGLEDDQQKAGEAADIFVFDGFDYG